MGVLDNPATVDLLQEALAATHAKMNVVVDVFAGLEREGCQPGESALHLAQRIGQSKHLKLAGIMGFSPCGHTHGWATRKKRCCDDLAPVLETAELCRRSGLPIELITGGSTGTYDIDPEYRLTESQAGSYVFMDVRYRSIGSKADDTVYADFGPALTVLATVINKTRPDRCTLDYGSKAMLNVSDEIKDRVGARIQPAGAEHGMLSWKHGQHDVSLGERLEIYPWIADTTVSVFDRIYVTRGETIVDVWPIMGRGGAPQR
jgi:D-serine deaminase-like pyridoxal phosphate-dependent protein